MPGLDDPRDCRPRHRHRRRGSAAPRPYLHALHRWDIAGDDDTSLTLLAKTDLVEHSVGVLGRILLVAGREHDPDPDSEFHVRLRSEGQPDLRVQVENGTASLAWAEDDRDEPDVDLDAAARHLFIWGRRPDSRGRLNSQLRTLECWSELRAPNSRWRSANARIRGCYVTDRDANRR